MGEFKTFGWEFFEKGKKKVGEVFEESSLCQVKL